jgi:hypothetical protein
MFRKFAILLSLLLLAAAAGAWLCRDLVASLLIDRLEDATKASGLSLSIEKQAFNYQKLELNNVRLDGVIQGIPLSLKVDELTLVPAWSALLRGNAEATLKGRLYRGTLDAQASLSLGTGALLSSGTLERLELSEHPLLATLGIDRGQLTLVIPSFALKDRAPTGTFELTIIKARKSFATTLTKGVPMPITIPAFERADLSLKGGLTPSGLILRPASLSCDFGSASGDLSAIPSPGSRSIELEGDFEVSITDAGGTLLGDWLPLLSQGTLNKESRSFGVHIEGPSQRPQIRMTPR